MRGLSRASLNLTTSSHLLNSQAHPVPSIQGPTQWSTPNTTGGRRGSGCCQHHWLKRVEPHGCRKYHRGEKHRRCRVACIPMFPSGVTQVIGCRKPPLQAARLHWSLHLASNDVVVTVKISAIIAILGISIKLSLKYFKLGCGICVIVSIFLYYCTHRHT